MTNPIALLIGTRPDSIKMLPLYFAFKKLQIPIVLCSTKQQSHILDEVFTSFNVIPDYELDLTSPSHNLFDITNSVLDKTGKLFSKINPTLVMVHGSSTSGMAAALAAFYLHIPIGHIEAGLRTDDIRNPFPEEMNRRFISMIAQYHFAPTEQAVTNLKAERINHDTIYYTGNTIVDSIRIIQEKINKQELTIKDSLKQKIHDCIATGKKTVLLTLSRRELYDGRINRVLEAIKEFALSHPNVYIFYPIHPHPIILEAIAQQALEKIPTINLCKALPYHELIYLLSKISWVATDSAGIQEEAASLGKQTLILRDKTECNESIWAGLATLVGTQKETIIANMEQLAQAHSIHAQESSIYGDGHAADLIATIIDAKRKNLPWQPTKSIQQMLQE
jgi:UDP-N-acetylglucosamine 2-epimerase (non-hydrolysing)